MRHRVLTIIASGCAWTLGAQPAQRASAPTAREFAVDFGASIVEFSIPFAFSRVKGRFTNASGTILYDEAQPAASSVTMMIDAKSIDTGWPHRDEHLRTSDFFDVDKYPTIVFQSERLVPNAGGFTARGKLTLHGVTKDVAIPFHLLRPPTRSPESRWLILNVEGALRLARADFGIVGGSTYNSWFNHSRAATMGDSVDVSLEIEGYSPDAASQRVPAVEEWLQRVRTNGVQSQIDRVRQAVKTATPAQLAGYESGADLVTRGLIATGQVADAITFGRTITEIWPASTRLAAAYALALSISGDQPAAVREYARMKQVFRAPVPEPNEKFPQVDESWYYVDQLARTAVEWGFSANAVPLARVIAELYPGTARAHTTLGYVLAANGDAPGAAAAYSKALEVDPRETRALEWKRRLP
jgi:polyisoprenoid-binding protein YceI